MKRSYKMFKGAEYLIVTAKDIKGRHMPGDSTLADVKEIVGIHGDCPVRIVLRGNDGSRDYQQQGTGYTFNVKPVGGNFPK